MKIEKINNKDIFQIQSMWEELNKLHGQRSNNFKEHFESFSFEERIKQVEHKEAVAVFVANIESRPVGYCMASVQDQIGEIDSIYINPQYRGRKLGEQLMEKAESWLKSKNIIKSHISVVEGNESVFDFYHKQGYLPRYTMLEKKHHP